MNFFTRQWQALLLAAVGTVCVSYGDIPSDLVGQDALVPFLVNVNAEVKAYFSNVAIVSSGGMVSTVSSGEMIIVTDEGMFSVSTALRAQAAAAANVETVLRIPLSNTAVLNRSQRQADVPTTVGKREGKVTVNLPTQSYGNAEILLYSVTGKRIMRQKVSMSNAANNIPHLNIATGVYLLSIRGTDGNALTSRLTHSGGNLDINITFANGNENRYYARQLAKESAGYWGGTSGWHITVSASGYADTSYEFNPVSGTNPQQNITLRQSNGGGGNNTGGSGSVEFVTIGGKNWMKKNLNIETAGSSCYLYNYNRPDTCAKYGRKYTWAAARTVCPTGWHLPTRDEWGALAKAAGGTGTYGATGPAGKKLKSTSGWNENGNGTDEYGFSALPSGERLLDGSFRLPGCAGFWWTATEYSDGLAYGRGMGYNYDYVYEGNYDKDYAFSVRCVQD